MDKHVHDTGVVSAALPMVVFEIDKAYVLVYSQRMTDAQRDGLIAG